MAMRTHFAGTVFDTVDDAIDAAEEEFEPGTKVLLVQVNEENNGERFWEHEHAPHMGLGELHLVANETLEAWSALPGWHEGPEHAENPILVTEEITLSRHGDLLCDAVERADCTIGELVDALGAGSDVAAGVANFESVGDIVGSYWTRREVEEIESALGALAKRDGLKGELRRALGLARDSRALDLAASLGVSPQALPGLLERQPYRSGGLIDRLLKRGCRVSLELNDGVLSLDIGESLSETA